ncbi:hypothetical protein O6H91_08G087300 [Diphasiastrum complanatum]|uniref:Uncharacterized protein n=1 Tax=Diphasiastrum complanatum TaxID=34168 RepID=A0ACC2CZP4_DIPCM|nr:hypothetical protein O6H91_08G087300 [Diphasiastrum complanatum]
MELSAKNAHDRDGRKPSSYAFLDADQHQQNQQQLFDESYYNSLYLNTFTPRFSSRPVYTSSYKAPEHASDAKQARSQRIVQVKQMSENDTLSMPDTAGIIDDSSNIGDWRQHSIVVGAHAAGIANSVSVENIHTDAHRPETSPSDVSRPSQPKTQLPSSGTNGYYYLHLKPLPCSKYLLPTRKISASVSRNVSFASSSAAPAVAFDWEEVPGKPKQNCVVDNEVPLKLPPRLEAQINQRSSIGVAVINQAERTQAKKANCWKIFNCLFGINLEDRANSAT